MAIIIDGKLVAQEVKAKVSKKVKELQKNRITPGLAVIIIGNNQASRIYVNNKKKACAEISICSKEYALPDTTSQKELIELISKLNNDDSINGILVQLPLPNHINEKAVIEAIDPLKDVDAFHEINVGKIMIGEYDLLPCTPAGIIELLNSQNIEIEGKHCVVVGRSNIVGKPVGALLLKENCTVTMCHSKTKNLREVCKRSDILVVAIGKAKFIDDSFVKEGAIVIDVGTNSVQGKITGDVDFDKVIDKASFVTPVPGGVGALTTTLLMKNACEAIEKYED